MGQYIFGLSTGNRAGTLWLGLIFTVWSIDTCCHGNSWFFFYLHDLVLTGDDDIQDAYCKLYNFCIRSLKSSTKLKA